ncbi:MAG: hypothetical protein EA349_09090 [Halomonadaceae bacterium]|nr:MAG: hypothetical protein EA349_09090 [Halomonadaceae bacterium]
MSMPVRLDDRLVRHAAAEGQLNHRSTPKQIELWAQLGRLIADQVTAQDILALTQGLTRVQLQRPTVTPPSSDLIWDQVDQRRDKGELSQQLRQDRVVYQSAPRHPGYLEAIHPDGRRVIGQFRDGVFVCIDGRDHAA